MSLLSLLHDARQHIVQYPSEAEDAGTPLRTTVHLLQRMLNSLHGKEEYSASQATGALLGFKAENHLTPGAPLFAPSAVKFAQEALKIQDAPSDTASESSFGSSGLGSDAERDFDALLTKDFQPQHDNSDDEEQEASILSLQRNADPPDCRELLLEPDAPAPPSDVRVEDTVSSAMQAQVNMVTGHKGSIPIRFIDGKYAPVFQHYDFLHKPKGMGLEEMSLYEFVACFQRMQSTERDKERMEQEAESAPAEEAAPKRGRRAVTRFPFTSDHPLHATHHLQLRAQQALPIIVGRIPRFPAKRPSGRVTAAYKRDADRFAAWALTLFHPWDPVTGVPKDLSWNRFCDWVLELQQKDTIVARTRLAFVTNAAHGLRSNHAADAKLRAWRFREATHFDELPVKYQPAAYKAQCSGKGGEPPIFSKASREEAELVVNELANMMGEQSTKDEQTNSMIRRTVDTVKQIFQHVPDTGARLSFRTHASNAVSRSCVPFIAGAAMHHNPNVLDMHDAIKAFTADQADQVHARNCGTDTASSECSSPVSIPDTCSEPEPPKVWSPDQASILQRIQSYITRLRRCFPAPSMKKSPALPTPLRLFVCGGPGTGKSTVISEAARLFQDNQIQIKCGAPTGVAAGSMRIPSATTLHTGWKIPRQGSEEAAVTIERNEPLPFHRKHLDRLREAFTQSIQSGIPFVTFIDEVLPFLCVPPANAHVLPPRSPCSPAFFSATFFSAIRQSNPTWPSHTS